MNLCQKQKIFAACAALLSVCGLGGCASGQSPDLLSSGSSSVSQTPLSNPSAPYAAAKSAEYDAKDLEEAFNESQSTTISLNGSTASISGAGASVNGSTVTITDGGTYLVSGTLSDGQILVNAGKNDIVRLVFRGVQISSSTSSPVYIQQADKTILTLEEGTENILSDAAEYQYPDTAADEPNAALFSKDDLTINGSGSLTVQGNYRHGICGKDDLVITNGSIQVTAVEDGIRGRDSVSVKSGTLTIQAGEDGIKSNNDEDPEKGWICLDGGTFRITSGQDGIQAETSLLVNGGEYEIVTGGGSVNGTKINSTPSEAFGKGQRMDRGQMPEGFTPGQEQAPGLDSSGNPGPGNGQPPSGLPGAENGGQGSTPTGQPPELPEGEPGELQQGVLPGDDESTEETEPSVSAKALKAGTLLAVRGGALTLDAMDDALHSNGDVTIQEGTLSIATGDDAVHADGALEISGGTVAISQCYEGLEGKTVLVSGGQIQLTASDDGVNAADGTASSTAVPGMAASSDVWIRVTGGVLSVNASGDGLDTNGNLYLEGGTVLVNGPTSGGDSALDYDGTCEITGGVLAAAGSPAMLQVPGQSSTQNTLTVVYSSAQAAGTLVTLADQNGVPLFSFTPEKQYQSIIISTPELQQGAAYSLYSGGSVSGEASYGYASGGTYTAGTQLGTVTLSGTVTTVSETGETVQAGMGGMDGGKMNRGARGNQSAQQQSGTPAT